MGFLGVEIFFVLSGYLIGGILLKEFSPGRKPTNSSLFTFWKRRWFRTLPNYYLFLVLNVVTWRWVGGEWPWESRNFFWFGQSLLSPHPIFFNVAWSLAVEEWFYLLFPLMLWLIVRAGASRDLAFGLSVTIFLVVPLALRWFVPSDGWDAGVRKVTFLRLDAIMFGIGLAYLKRNAPAGWRILKMAWPLGIIGVLAICGYLVKKPELTVASFFDRTLLLSVTPLSVALLFPRVLDMPSPVHRLAHPIRQISLWSYSMYLSHDWLGLLATGCFLAAGWSIHGMNAVLLSFLNLSGTLLVSALLYKYYEKPVMDLRDRAGVGS
jgi:peptidoglycan/LPS O-acetylase OafA/YrhL